MRNYEIIYKNYVFSLPFLLHVAKYSYVLGIFTVGLDMKILALSSIPHCRARQGSEYAET